MNIFVGCSSRDEISKDYLDLATQVGDCLNGAHFIIGGTFRGMMGSVVKNIPRGDITQIILKDYADTGVLSSKQYQICETSFERMERIWNETDVFLILPGGTGTLGEIITFLEENRMKSEKKKIIVFNYRGFYDQIVAFIQDAKEQHFCNDDILEGLIFIDDIPDILNLLKEEQRV